MRLRNKNTVKSYPPGHGARRAALILALFALMPLLAGCAGEAAARVEEAALTDEAKAAFSALAGEQGVMLYGDPKVMTSKAIRMYAVLYGPVGQELTLSHFWKTLEMEIGGASGDGYSVWRVEYHPRWVEKAYFEADGKEYGMDAYEELTFPVEEALRAEWEEEE